MYNNIFAKSIEPYIVWKKLQLDLFGLHNCWTLYNKVIAFVQHIIHLANAAFKYKLHRENQSTLLRLPQQKFLSNTPRRLAAHTPSNSTLSEDSPSNKIPTELFFFPRVGWYV